MTPQVSQTVKEKQTGRCCTAWHNVRAQRFVLIGLLIVLLGGCGGAITRPADRELRVALNPWPGYAFLFLAEELGYFEREGVRVRLIELETLSDSGRVFEQGNADVICCSLVEVLLMNSTRGDDRIQAFMACDYSNGGDVLLARDTIATVAELRGKKIGLEPGSLDGLCVHLALQSAGLSITDVTIVPLAQVEMLEALEQGRVDAVQVYPPRSSDLAELPGMHRLWDTSRSPWAIVDVLAANTNTMRVRDRQLRALERAYHRAQQYYLEHPADAESILARRCHMDVDSLRTALGHMKILGADSATQDELFQGDSLHDAIQQTAESLAAIGMLPHVPAGSPLNRVRKSESQTLKRAVHRRE